MQKTILRDQFKAYRKRLLEHKYATLCRQIAANVITIPELLNAQVVHAFWPHLPVREIDIRSILCYLRALGCKIVLPVVNFASKEPRLTHRIFISERDLVPNHWGILEPMKGPECPPQDIDVVLVPALGLDHGGHRVGFGKGYYDAFLSQVDALFICPMFEACIVNRIQAEPHDVRIDVIVTEHTIRQLSLPTTG